MSRTSPIYGRNNDASEATNTHFGKRVISTDGEVDTDDAWMTDGPWLPWTQGRPHEQTFETAALSLEGEQADTYYGTVSWGVQTDGRGNVTLAPLTVVSMGTPTAPFMASAGHWNDQQVDIGGAATDTENLPLTTHRTADLTTLDVGAIASRVRMLKDELSIMDPATVEYKNKNLELIGLANELARRSRMRRSCRVGRQRQEP